MKSFDVIVLGGGPGGYTAAIRAAQLGKKTAIVEGQKLGGVCLNRGCIPSKAMLKAAYHVQEMEHFSEMGIHIEVKKLDGGAAVARAKKISKKISKGIDYLMEKNKITTFRGWGRLHSPNSLALSSQSKGKGDREEIIQFTNLILATGAKYKSFPSLQHDGDKIIGAFEATQLEELPKSAAIIGGGAIGVEFAYFWNTFGTKVHLFEQQPYLLPLEDRESSKELQKYYQKYGIQMNLGAQDIKVRKKGEGVEVESTLKGKTQKKTFDLALLAIGMTGVQDNLGLEEVGIKTGKHFIPVNSMYQTNLSHIYAVGDVCGPPLLAHAAAHEGVIAAEHLAGDTPHPLNKNNIPACTYSMPQIASVGKTEEELKDSDTPYQVGKVPFSANGKAIASEETSGFVKVLMGEHGEMLGAHIVGHAASELIHEYTLFQNLEGIDEEIFNTVHPHPTLGEWLSEAVMNANKRSLNL